MTETPDCWGRLRLALIAEGSLTDIAHALHPTSVYTVKAWREGTYRPSRLSLAHIKATWPDLASVVQACQDDLTAPLHTDVSSST